MQERLPIDDKQAQACARGIHVFVSAKRKDTPRYPTCVTCGRTTVDWDRARRLDPDDYPWKIQALKSEYCRYEMWTCDIDLPAVNHAKRKGREAFPNYVKKRIERALSAVHPQSDGVLRPFRDGFQTPYSGNIVYYAQHATGNCCRKCTWRWHGIEQHRELTSVEVEYILGLILRFIDERLPQLTPAGERIPSRRRG